MNMESLNKRVEEVLKNTPESREFWKKEVIDSLKNDFGIENLSTLELFRLNKITEEVMERLDPKLDSEDKFCVDWEIVNRFFLDLYGISTEYVNKHIETEEDKEAFFEYIRKTRERAHLI